MHRSMWHLQLHSTVTKHIAADGVSKLSEHNQRRKKLCLWRCHACMALMLHLGTTAGPFTFCIIRLLVMSRLLVPTDRDWLSIQQQQQQQHLEQQLAVSTGLTQQ